MKRIADFFILCSGTRKEILDNCPTERTKFAGIGSIIFLTALLAVFSGGYAMYITFKNLNTAIFFGVLWGIVIFCLDRYIVSSIRKERGFMKEFKMAVPRLMMAIVLAFTISKPIELKLFEGPILKELGQERQVSDSICEKNFNTTRGTLENNISTLRSELQDRKNEIYNNDPVFKKKEELKVSLEKTNTNLNNQIQSNLSIIKNNTTYTEIRDPETDQIKGVWRYNSLARAKAAENKALRGEMTNNRQSMNDMTAELTSRKNELEGQVKVIEQQYTDQIAGVQKHIESLDADRQSIISQCKADASKNTDLIGQLVVLSKLTKNQRPVMWASIFITALFLLIEVAPISVKLLAKRGPYDDILERIEEVISLEQKRFIVEKNKELETFSSQIEELSKQKIQMEITAQSDKIAAKVKADKELLDDISQKVSALARLETEKWYNEEVEKRATKTSDPSTSKAQGNGVHPVADNTSQVI